MQRAAQIYIELQIGQFLKEAHDSKDFQIKKNRNSTYFKSWNTAMDSRANAVSVGLEGLACSVPKDTQTTASSLSVEYLRSHNLKDDYLPGPWDYHSHRRPLHLDRTSKYPCSSVPLESSFELSSL